MKNFAFAASFLVACVLAFQLYNTQTTSNSDGGSKDFIPTQMRGGSKSAVAVPTDKKNEQPLAYLVDITGEIKITTRGGKSPASCEVLFNNDIVILSAGASAKIMYSDAIFDIVSSGSTLVSNQLKEVEVIMQSEALLIANNNLSEEKQAILNELLFRFEAIQVAEGKKYVLLNAPKDKMDEIIEVLPGMKSPTITPLADGNWVSVQSVIAEKHFWEIIGKLKSLGAEGILVLPIEKMIL